MVVRNFLIGVMVGVAATIVTKKIIQRKKEKKKAIPVCKNGTFTDL